MAERPAIFAFVPGILSVSSSWASLMPQGVSLLPVDYRPSDAEYRDVRGASVDFVEIAAYRLLSKILTLSASGKPWVLAGHSAGGAVVYRCMGHFASLLMTPEVSALAITKGAGRFLLSREGKKLSRLLEDLGGKPPPNPPVAVLSFEGTLLPCDVDGWADEWARSDAPLEGILEDLEMPGSP